MCIYIDPARTHLDQKEQVNNLKVSYEVKNLQVNIVSHGSKSGLIQYFFIKLQILSEPGGAALAAGHQDANTFTLACERHSHKAKYFTKDVRF